MFTSILKYYEAVDTTRGTDKNTSHSYGPVYDSLFLKYKDTTSNILEIGISGGHALLAYADYFEKGSIYGLDIEDNCNYKSKIHKRIKLQFGDAKSEQVIKNYEGKQFDIIIEDASHLPDDQIRHFMDFNQFVAPGGIYIIEDIEEKHIDYVSGVLKPYSERHGFECNILDLRTVKGRFDDILLVFKKK